MNTLYYSYKVNYRNRDEDLLQYYTCIILMSLICIPYHLENEPIIIISIIYYYTNEVRFHTRL